MLDLAISLLTSALAFTLAIAVIVKNQKSASNVYLGLLIFCLSLYPIFNYLALSAQTESLTQVWAMFILMTAIPAGPLFLSFVRVFPTSKFIFWKKKQIFLWVWAALNIFFALSGLIFTNVSTNNGELIITPGPAVLSFGLLQVTTILAGMISLVIKYRSSKGMLRLQLQYIVIGITLSFGLMLLSTVVLPLVFGVTFFVSLSPLFLLFGIFTVALAVIRHQLLDIRPIIARGVTFILLVLFLGVLYSSLFIIISAFVFGIPVSASSLMLTTVLALMIAFSFQRIARYIRKITDQFFFSDYYNTEELLYNLAVILGSSILLEEISHKVILEMTQAMRLSRGIIILSHRSNISKIITEKFQNPPEINARELLSLFKNVELVNIERTDSSKKKDVLNRIGVTVLTKLQYEDQLVGYLGFGEKSSGSNFTDADIRVIKIITSQTAVAIQNTKAYEEIQRFNVTLKEEVDNATHNLKKANARLRELDRMKDEFVSLASHELRTPLTSIKYYLWMTLRGKGGKLEEKQRFFLDRAYSSTTRLTKMVNDMLNISRIESNRVVLSPFKTKIYATVEDVADEIRPKAKELGIQLTVVNHGLKLHTQHKVDLPDVLIDRDKIKEVLVNLIGNALKFTPKGGLVKIWFEVNDDFVYVHVTDSGIGFNPTKKHQLFKKFGMIRESYAAYKDASQGTGLGLYICKSIIDLHGGHISAESEGQGKGATFSFSIPIYTEKLKTAFSHEFAGKIDAGIIMTQVMAE